MDTTSVLIVLSVTIAFIVIAVFAAPRLRDASFSERMHWYLADMFARVRSPGLQEPEGGPPAEMPRAPRAALATDKLTSEAPGRTAADRILDTRSGRVAVALLLVLPVAYVMQPGIIYRDKPYRDSGVFLYTGWRILDGAVPYRDVWDHKGPLIFYINALGLWLGRGSIWGVLAIQFIALAAALVLCFLAVRRELGGAPALLAALLCVIALPFVLQHGNLVEQYAITLQFAGVYLFVIAERERRYGRTGLLIGATLALAALLRPNLVGVWVAILLYVLSRLAVPDERRFYAHSLRRIALGAAAVLAPVLLYFTLTGAINHFVTATLQYNVTYVDVSMGSRKQAITEGLEILSVPGMAFFALPMWLVAVAYVIRYRGKLADISPLVRLVVLWLPIDLLFVSLSGRFYLHYYLTLMPVFSVLAAFLVSHVLRTAPDEAGPQPEADALFRTWLPAGVLVAAALIAWPKLYEQDRIERQVLAGFSYAPAVEYITASTSEDDHVLLWGAEPAINFLARRRSPTRFVYQYPLYTAGGQRGALARDFLRDLQARPPALIVDASARTVVDGVELVPPLDPAQREQWHGKRAALTSGAGAGAPGIVPEMEPVFAWIQANYQPAGSVSGFPGWVAYTFVGAR